MHLVRFVILISLVSALTGCEPSRSNRQKASGGNGGGDSFDNGNGNGGGNTLTTTGWSHCGVSSQSGQVGPTGSARSLEIKNFCRNKDSKNVFRFTLSQGNSDVKICVFPSYNMDANGVPGAQSHYIGSPICFNNGPNEELEKTFTINPAYGQSTANELVFLTEGSSVNSYVNCMDAIPAFMSGQSQAHLSVCADPTFQNNSTVRNIQNSCGASCADISRYICRSYPQSTCCQSMASQVRAFACNYYSQAHRRMILDFRASP